MSTPATGYIPRDYQSFPVGSSPFASQWDEQAMPLLSMKEAAEICEEQAAKGIDPLGMAIKYHAMPTYQNGIPYCWAHAAVMGLKLAFAMSGQTPPRFSATAMGYKIKNGQERGGNAFEAFPFMARHGVPTVDFWPENEMRSHDTPEMRENAKLHLILEWWELPANSDQHKWTALANRFSIWTGYANIGHAMLAARFQLDRRGNPMSRDINSWNGTASRASRWDTAWLNDRNVIWDRGGRDFGCFEQYAIRVSTVVQ